MSTDPFTDITGAIPFVPPVLELTPYKPKQQTDSKNIMTAIPEYVSPGEFYGEVNEYLGASGFSNIIRRRMLEEESEYGIISNESEWPIKVKVLPDFEITDEINNDYGTSFMHDKIAGMSNDMFRDLGQLQSLGVDIGGLADKTVKGASNLASGIPGVGGTISDILKNAGSVAAGSRFDMAHVWKDSQYTQSYPFSSTFFCANPASLTQITEDIVRPLCIFLNLAAPRADVTSTYKYPFLVSASIPGLFRIKIGAITNLSITKTTEHGLAQNQRPIAVKLTFNITNLYHVLLGGKYGSTNDTDRITIASYLEPLRRSKDSPYTTTGISALDQQIADAELASRAETLAAPKLEKAASEEEKKKIIQEQIESLRQLPEDELNEQEHTAINSEVQKAQVKVQNSLENISDVEENMDARLQEIDAKIGNSTATVDDLAEKDKLEADKEQMEAYKQRLLELQNELLESGADLPDAQEMNSNAANKAVKQQTINKAAEAVSFTSLTDSYSTNADPNSDTAIPQEVIDNKTQNYNSKKTAADATDSNKQLLDNVGESISKASESTVESLNNGAVAAKNGAKQAVDYSRKMADKASKTADSLLSANTPSTVKLEYTQKADMSKLPGNAGSKVTNLKSDLYKKQ